MTIMTIERTLRQLKASPVARPLVNAVKEFRTALPVRTSALMFHTGRCGSTVLAKMLNQHSDIYWAGEIFERMPERYSEIASRPDAVELIIDERRRECRRRGKRTFGFELKYLPGQHFGDGFITMSLEDYVAFVRKLGFSKFIVLHRHNYLRRALSSEVLRQNRSGHAKASPRKATRITLDLQALPLTSTYRSSLVESFRFIDEHYSRLVKLLAGAEVLHLSYEDDVLQDPTAAYRKVCSFLDVDAEAPEIPLARTNPFPCEDIVENIDELRAALRNTRYEWMLD
jgi:LPS sulfotransferase NodH